MNKIVKHRAASKDTPETLQHAFGEDAWLLGACARWHIARAQQKINWAQNDVATGYGHFNFAHTHLVDTTPLDEMRETELHLANGVPRTITTACELLGICLEIMNQRNIDPESTMSEGPVIEILRNVLSSLDHLPPDVRLVTSDHPN